MCFCPPSSPVNQLVNYAHSRHVPNLLRSRIRKMGNVAGACLTERLDDPEWQRGLLFRHMARLLAELQYLPAVLRLANHIADDTNMMDATDAIVDMGPPAARILIPMGYTHPEDVLDIIAEAATGEEMPDVQDLMRAKLPYHTELVSNCISIMQDEELLHDMLKYVAICPNGPQLEALMEAIETFGVFPFTYLKR